MTVAIIVQGSVFANSNESIIAWGTQWGWSSAIQVPGDYDGDGVFDLAVYDPSGGYWYIESLVGETTYKGEYQGTAAGNAVFPLVKIEGTMAQLPVKAGSVTIVLRDLSYGYGYGTALGTFTDDGVGQLSGTFLVGGVIQFPGSGVINYSTGAWYLNLALPGIQEGIKIIANYIAGSPSRKIITWRNQWGWNGAKPVPGDYDGDGQYDLAVVDPASGKWYIKSLQKNKSISTFVRDENQGTAVATPTDPLVKISGMLMHTPVAFGSVSIVLREVSTGNIVGTFTDNGAGQLTGTFLVGGVIQFPGLGEINYDTGMWYLNLAVPGVQATVAIPVSYRYWASLE